MDGSIFAAIYQYCVVAYFISCVGVIQCGGRSTKVGTAILMVPLNIFQAKRFIRILGVYFEYK
jgi:hypothetical protein